MTTLSSTAYQSAWLKEYFSNNHNFVNAVIAQNLSATDPIEHGTALQGAKTALAVCDSTGPATCVLVSPRLISAASLVAGSVKCLVLVRGPATVDSDNMTLPGTGGDDALADLEALGIVDMPIKATWTTQTT